VVKIESQGAWLRQPMWNRSANDVNGFYNALRMRMKNPELYRGSSAELVKEKLAKLKSLLDAGTITEEEYAKARLKILEKIQ
jgi:Short C-terminal domain